MSHDEEEEVEDGFKMEGSDGDEPLDVMDDMPDFDLDDEDPDKDK